MPYLKILSDFLFGGSSLIYIIPTVLTIIGLFPLFRKSGVSGWWAFCPWAREYWLGRCAGKEPEGRIVSVGAFLSFLITAAAELISAKFLETHENQILLISVLVLVFRIIIVVYEIQIYTGLCEVYGARKRWLILWIFADWIPALIWGFSKQYQPMWQVDDFRNSAVSHVSGSNIEDIGEGLTVNLKERSVTEFFQKKVLLRDIHMNIKPGRLVMLLGGSGAGKTTYLNAINGYEKADAKVMLNGRDVYEEYAKMQFEIGFVPQSDLMRGKDTAYNTLLDYALMRLPSDFSMQDRRDRVEEALKVFGLAPARNTLVEKMSGGQRKRLSIAMEYLSNPYLFILDEPDSGLDGVMARELFIQLRKASDTGRIVLVITHTPDRVIDLFDDIIILAKDSTRTGRLAFYGTVEECRKFFGKDRMEEIVKCINQVEEGGEGRADEFIMKYAEVQHV